MKPCPALWETPTINWDGDVTVCCTDVFLRLVLGNIKDKPFREIWTSEKITELRIKHIKGETNDIPVCKECNGLEPEDKEKFKENLIHYLTKIGRPELVKFVKQI